MIVKSYQYLPEYNREPHSPPPPAWDTIYLDLETTSGNRNVASVNPWDTEHCKICGLAITGDYKDIDPDTGEVLGMIEHEEAYYIPRHVLDTPKVREWLEDKLENATQWVNHNPKYDVHVLYNDLGLVFDCSEGQREIIDTLNNAKIYNLSERDYSLEAVAKRLLGKDIYGHKLALAPYLDKNKDYGKIPIDVIGPYACEDVLTAREIHKFLLNNIPVECNGILETEQKLTPIFVDMERKGMRVEYKELTRASHKALSEMLDIEEWFTEELGYLFNPKSRGDLEHLLHETLEIPVLYKTDGGKTGIKKPSFDREAMSEYTNHPMMPLEYSKKLSRYNSLSIHRGLFYEPWRLLAKDGVVHCSFNQQVRSGRMSCKAPNMQQLDTEGKLQFFPREGCSFLDIDYSQLEFRLIVHYIENEAAIRAYLEDPTTDFHSYTAKSAGIERRPAKTVNFCVGFGAGKRKVLSLLKALYAKSNPDWSLYRVTQKASEVYTDYHKLLPELRPTSKSLEALCKSEGRGYVQNIFGRRLHLDRDHSYRAFNRVVQSTGIDLLKRKLVLLDPVCRELHTSMLCVVHDSVLFEIPTTDELEARAYADKFQAILNEPSDQEGGLFRVPILSDSKWSAKSWGHCKAFGDDDTTFDDTTELAYAIATLEDGIEHESIH